MNSDILLGKNIVVTRARHQASDLVAQLKALGANVLEAPMIEIVPLQDTTPVEKALCRLKTYHWAVFTSVNSVEYTFRYLTSLGMGKDAFEGVQIAAIGPATQKALEHYGLVPNLLPQQYVAESLFEALQARMKSLQGQRIFLPQGDLARPVLYDSLQSAGAQVDAVTLYQTRMPQGADSTQSLLAKLKARQIDMILFTSASTVENFAAILATSLQQEADLLAGVQLAAIGPVTGKALLSCFQRVDIEAKTHTIPGLIEALC